MLPCNVGEVLVQVLLKLELCGCTGYATTMVGGCTKI